MRLLLLALGVLLVAGCGGSESTSLPQGSEPANLDSADFVEQIDNPYWPMSPGSRWVYREDGQRVEVTVTDETKEILGIDATVVHDVVTEDGELIEDTYDCYAQDADGNVWYLGEETKEYENGKVKTTAGSWEAGVDGAEAGVVMPGDPEVGMVYRQEYYEGEAEDVGEILSLDEKAEVPFGAFDEVLMTKDTTPLEPDVLEHKLYAKGVGPVLVLKVSGETGREELVSFLRGLNRPGAGTSSTAPHAFSPKEKDEKSAVSRARRSASRCRGKRFGVCGAQRCKGDRGSPGGH